MSLVFEVTEWGRVTVRSQEEWDALKRHKPAGARFARIDAPASETICFFHSDGGLAVTVAGESSVALSRATWMFVPVIMRVFMLLACASCTLAKTRLCGRVAW